MFDKYFNQHRFSLRERIDYVVSHNSWVCPIEFITEKDSYYQISKHRIVMPPKSKFDTLDEYYGVLIHNMCHSIGGFKPKDTEQYKSYIMEELVCECASAMILSIIGIKKTINEDSAMYIKAWRDEWDENELYKIDVKTGVRDRVVNFINQIFS